MRLKLTSLLTLLSAFVMQFTFAQEKTITGTVTDDFDMPLPGANVMIKGTTTGAQTDFDGNYSIAANEGDVLVFSYIGQKTEERTVGAENVINVKLVEDAQALEEVVVIGYGKQTKQKLVQSVSTVSSEQIKDVPAVAPQELLQGQASGVQVVNSSGILGAAPVIKIRGVASINAGGRPLVVVDGVPMNDANLSAGQGGQALNPLGDINPNDIESFSVLKDAAATAIYGSRGANGVVLITTKSGKRNQKTRINLAVNTSWSKSTDIFDMMDADQFRGHYAAVNNVDESSLPQGGFDWPSNVVRTGFSKDLNFSISGGGEKTTFFAGLTYKDQEGFIIGNNLNRMSGRLNLTHEANDWFRMGMNLSVTENRNDRVGSENSTFAPLTSAFLQTPWVEPYDENGNYVNTGFIANVIAIEDLDINDSNSFRTVGNIYGELNFTDELYFRTDFGIDRVQLEEFQRSFEINSPGGYASNYVAQQNKYVFNNSLNWNHTFGDFHDLSTVVGMSYEQTDIRDIYVEATGFLSDDQINTASGSEFGTTQNTVTGSRLAGYFARANYSYKNKYTVEASFRRDGSSRFGADNKYGNFWALGGAWMVSDEAFMSDVEQISTLKVRANMGTSGNDRIGDFASLGQYVGGNIANYNGESGLRPTTAPNPNLQWERSKSYDIGFELGMFNDRVNLNFDYYNKTTSDLILNQPIPQTNGGFDFIIANLGEMENRGVDLDISTTNIQTEDFRWTTSLNIGFNENEVISLPGASIDDEGRRFVNGTSSQRAIEGYSVNTFYLIRYKGVNPETGDAEWLDKNGNPTTSPTADDRVIVGDANPDFTGGFRNTLTWKNWDLNVFFNFSYGNDIMIDGLRFTDNPNGSFNKRTALLNVWENPGDEAYLPSYNSSTINNFSQRSTAQLRDGSFARLKNMTLGYTFPTEFLESTGIVSGARIYFTANNLLTIKGSDMNGIDPEVTDTVGNLGQGESFFTPPQSKTYLVGVRLSF